MRVLICISESTIRDTLSFSIESRHSVKTINAYTVPQGLEAIIKDSKISFLIVDNSPGFDPILKYITAMKLKLTLTVCSKKELDPKDPIFEYKPSKVFLVEQGVEPILEFIGTEKGKAPTEEGEFEARDSEFCRVRTSLFAQKKLTTDLFLRLAPGKFVKLLNASDILSKKDYTKIAIEKKVEYLYVKAIDSAKMLEHLADDLKLVMGRPNPIDAAEIASVTASVLDAAHAMMKTVGLNNEMKAMIKDNVMLVVKSATKNKKLGLLISRLAKDRANYISSHSTALAQLACSIAASIEWGSALTFQKLTLAAFLHDITIQDEGMAMAMSNREKRDEVRRKYTKDQLRDFELHGSQSAQAVLTLSEVPPDVDTIIVQHHEFPDGAGFPRGIKKQQIAPLSAIFIVAHDVLDEMYANPDSFDINKYIKSREEIFDSGNFRKILLKLKDIQGLSPSAADKAGDPATESTTDETATAKAIPKAA